MQYRRLNPRDAFTDSFVDLRNRVGSLETQPTGVVAVREQLYTVDPSTGVATIIGQLPDGSYGIQEFVNDIEPPGQPSTPTAEPTIGGVILTWDGLIVGGAAQPKDYSRTEIEYSTNGTIWAKGGTLYDANSYTVPSLTIGTEHSFRLISYDKNNNASTPSNTVLGTPVAMLDNPDLEGALKDLRDKDTEIAGNVTNAATAAENAAADALEAFKKANGVPTTFYGPTRPPVDAERVFVVGDQWIDTDDSNKMYVWDGNDFILAIDAEGAATQALTDLGINQTWVDDIEAQADSSISTYLGTDTPVNAQIGDLWLTGNADSPLKRFNGTIWETFEDPNILAAYQKAVDAQSAADKKIRTFAQDTEPSGLTATDVGDLWIDTNDGGKVYRWDETDWVQVIDNGTAAVNTALANLGLDETWMNDIEAQADRAITTFYGTATPVNPLDGDLWLTGVAGEPMKRRSGGAWLTFEDPNVQAAYERAGTALTEADKKIRTFAAATAPAGMQPEDAGDLWIDTDDGKISRWQLVSGTTYGWVQLVDNGTNAANKALTDLGLNAQWKQDIENQADRAIATFYGSASPTGMQAGDIWLSGVAGVPMKRWDGDSWETFEDPNVAAAYGRAGQALTAADSKIITYAQTTAPTGLTSPSNDGDLWINTSTGVDKGKISRFANNAWTLVTDNGVAAANKALADLGINQTWVNSIEDQADRAIDTFFGTTTPVNPQDGDLWLTGVAGEPMKRRTNGAWVVFEDPNIQNAYQKAVDANNAAAKVFESARSYVNPGTALTSIRTASGLAPTVVDSTTAMGGKALQKSGTGTGWWVDEGGKQAFDPNALYRVTARMRVTSVSTVNGGTFYMGLQGYAADGITRVNAAGADTDSSQHYLHSSTAYAKDGTWTEYVGYVRGNSLAGTEGGGFIATDPKKLHKDVRYIAPMFILDYSGGNGTWELSHWSIDSIDAIGYQALVDAATAQGVADSKIRTYAQDTAPTGLALKDSGDLWINTTAGDIKGQVKRWDGDSWELVVESGATATKSVLDSLGLNQAFVDSVNTLEDKAITTFYGTDTPVGPKEGDLWLKGTGTDPMQRWTNGAWVKYENPAVQAAYDTAGDAEALADKKIVTYAQIAAPAGTVDLPLRTGDLWIDTDDANKLYRYVQGTGTGTGWIAVRDTGIGLAQDTANTALKATAFSGNASFDDWTSTLPNGFTVFTTNPTKETTTVRIPKNAARWNVTATGTQAGLSFTGGVVGGHLPNLEYYTVEVEFYLVSGTLPGSGVILDWFGMTNNRATLNLATEFPNGVNTGKWYRVTKTLRRPTNSAGTWSRMDGFLMANWSGFGGAVKNIIFDWFNIRPATAEEITTFGVPGIVQRIDGDIATKGKTIIQSAEPATADRLPQNLWIDTTPIGNPAAPGNIPKRWTGATTASGSWVAVTEKALVDAAAKAAKAAEDAAKAISDADLAYKAAGERSRIVHLNTEPPAPATGWKDGDVWFKHKTVDITSPVLDWYRWNNNGWLAQEYDETFLPAVNIGTGTYGSMSGVRLDANTVTAAQLRIGDFTNLITNGFGDLGLDSFGLPIGWAKGLIYETVDKPATVAGVFKTTSTQKNYVPPTEWIDVTPNTEYLTEIWIKADKPNSLFYLELRDQDGNHGTTNINLATGNSRGSYPMSGELVPTEWTLFRVKTTTNATTTRLRLGTIYFNHSSGTEQAAVVSLAIGLRRRMAGAVLVDGALDAMTITGALIQSRTENNKGIKLSDTQFVAYNDNGTESLRLDGTNAILTGAVVRTSATGARVQIDSTGLKVYAADGTTLTTDLNGTNNLITGRLATNAPGQPGVVLIPKTSTGLPGIWFSADGGTDGNQAAIYSDENWALNLRGRSNPAGGQGPIRVHGGILSFGTVQGYSNPPGTLPSWRIDSGGGASFKSVSVWANGGNQDNNVTANYLRTAPMGMPGIVILNTTAGPPGIWFSSDGSLASSQPAIYADSSYYLHFRGAANGPAAMQFNTGIRVDNWLDVYDPPTSTFAANVGISNSPKDRIYKLTSASKYKLAIDEKPIDEAYKILGLKPKTWFDRFQAETYADYLAGNDDVSLDDVPVLKRIPGLVAEDVQEAGLEEYVTYDVNGDIEGISYDRLWTLLIPLVKENREKILELEETIRAIQNPSSSVKKK